MQDNLALKETILKGKDGAWTLLRRYCPRDLVERNPSVRGIANDYYRLTEFGTLPYSGGWYEQDTYWCKLLDEYAARVKEWRDYASKQ